MRWLESIRGASSKMLKDDTKETNTNVLSMLNPI